MSIKGLLTKLFIVAAVTIGLSLAAPVTTYAEPACDRGCPNGGATAPNYQVDISPLPNVAANQSKIEAFLKIVFTVIGALSLLMVTIGGFKYVASQGDSQAVAKAKNTIIYALVGIVVSICAVTIVTFVIGRT